MSQKDEIQILQGEEARGMIQRFSPEKLKTLPPTPTATFMGFERHEEGNIFFTVSFDGGVAKEFSAMFVSAEASDIAKRHHAHASDITIMMSGIVEAMMSDETPDIGRN
jgi:hypothetical protein